MAYNSERNREMLGAYEAGRTIEQLARDYGLSKATIRPILDGERHRQKFSPDPYYRALREA